MPPEAWLREHHAYLQVMLALAAPRRRRRRAQQQPALPARRHGRSRCPCPIVTTLHTPPTPVAGARDRGSGPTPQRTLRRRQRAHRAPWSHVRRRRGRPQRRRRRPLDARARAATDLVWFGRIVPEKAPHLAIASPRPAGRRIRARRPGLATRPTSRRDSGRASATTWSTSATSTSASSARRCVGASAPCWSPRPGTSPTAWSPPSRWPAAPRCCAFARGGLPECGRAGLRHAWSTPGDVRGRGGRWSEAAALDRARGAAPTRCAHCSLERDGRRLPGTPTRRARMAWAA